MATTSTASATAEHMAKASADFLESLNPTHRAKASFAYEDGERVFWYYPPMNRHGLALRDMDAGQRKLAYAMMSTGLTEKSYEQAKLIIDHEEVLGPLEKEQGRISFVRDPELYYFTVFGEPGGEKPWGWRAEGHHVSLHFSIWGDKVISATPFFFGANPAEVRKGPKTGLRILGAREDMAFELMDSMESGQRTKAIIYDEAPWDIYTYNSSKPVLPPGEGLPVSRMTETQKGIFEGLVTEYVSQCPLIYPSRKWRSYGKGALTNCTWPGQVRLRKVKHTTTGSPVAILWSNSTIDRTGLITSTRSGATSTTILPRTCCAITCCCTTSCSNSAADHYLLVDFE